jgi:hypothetical protein
MRSPLAPQGTSQGERTTSPREYRDAKGEVHRHTKAYMEQHGGASQSAGGQGRARGSSQRSAGSARSEDQRSQPRRGNGDPAAGEDGRLGELFLVGLKDIYTAEKQMLRAMPKLSRQTQSEQFRQAMERHGEETETQVERLEQVFEMLGKPARGKAVRGDRRADQGSSGGRRRVQGQRCPRCRPDFGGAGARALRDRALRHAQGLGGGARDERRGEAPGRDAPGGEAD